MSSNEIMAQIQQVERQIVELEKLNVEIIQVEKMGYKLYSDGHNLESEFSKIFNKMEEIDSVLQSSNSVRVRKIINNSNELKDVLLKVFSNIFTRNGDVWWANNRLSAKESSNNDTILDYQRELSLLREAYDAALLRERNN